MKQTKNGWLKALLSYTGARKGKFYVSVILSVISIAAGLIPFFCMYRVILLFVDNAESVRGIFFWCIVSVAAYFIKVLCFSFSTALSHQVAYYVLEGLRFRVADCFLHAPLGEVQRHTIGELKNLIVDKIEAIEPPLAHMVPEGAGHIVLPVISIFALAVIDWRIALASLITFPASMICMMLTFKISGKNFETYNISNARMNSAIVEYIEGIEVIKTFGKLGVSYEKYSGAITDYRKFVLKWLSSTWVTVKLSFALFPSTLIGTLPVSLILASRHIITAPEAALAVMLSLSMVGSLSKLEVFANGIRQIKETVQELDYFLNMEKLPEPESYVEIPNMDIEMRDVCFSYTKEAKDNVLRNISLSLPKGSYTALVGPSGGGKSTVAKLIARFWDVSSGEICIGGINIKEIPLSQLSGLVSFVSQDNFLFQSSLMENIRLGNPNATDEEVMEAAKSAQCDDFISKLPCGYMTSAGEAGKSLSGGEKQRIAIARLILKDAPIVILDEATAFTDPENENKIQKAITSLAKGKTLLIIAHRLSTIRNADNIVVLKNGVIEAQGTHKNLLERCSLYREMWRMHIGAKNWAVSMNKKGVV